MSTEALRDYHIRRARTELDLAYRGTSQAVVDAHLRLSALHMRALHRLRATGPAPGHELQERLEARILA